MKEIKLTINSKEYSKTEPDIQDWFDNIDAQDGIQKGVATKAGATAYFKVVSNYLKIPLKELLDHGRLPEVTKAYTQINENLLECFGAIPKEEKNV